MSACSFCSTAAPAAITCRCQLSRRDYCTCTLASMNAQMLWLSKNMPIQAKLATQNYRKVGAYEKDLDLTNVRKGIGGSQQKNCLPSLPMVDHFEIQHFHTYLL